MNTNTEMIRCSNENMYVKMSRLKDIIMNTSDEVKMRMRLSPDAAVLTEMLTMGTLSTKCNHIPTKQTDVMAYERPIPSSTPDFVEDINMPMTTIIGSRRSMPVRSNPVTSAVISDCISILEFMDRFEKRPESTGLIILGNQPSLTHAATVACTFECVNAYCGWGPNVRMNMITDIATSKAMETYIGPRENVTITTCTDLVVCMNTMINASTSSYTTIIVHGEMLADVFMSRSLPDNMDINMVVPVNTIEIEEKIRRARREMDMLVEMCPCSDPSMNVVRVVPVHRIGDPLTMKIMFRRNEMPMFAFMRWYTIMIRRMKVETTCYDCSVALKLSSAILHLMSGREMDMGLIEQRRWSEYFSTTIELDDAVD